MEEQTYTNAETDTSAVTPFPRPDDFDTYWGGTLSALRAVPSDVRTERTSPVKGASPNAVAPIPRPVTVTKLTYASLDGKRPTGWLFQPTGASVHGALLFLPGYSTACGSELIHTVLSQIAQLGYAVLAVDPRGQGASRSEHPPSADGKIVTDVLCPESYVYRGIVADCVRGAEVLSELTALDDVGVFGHSQGGGLALITASLAPERVRAVGCMIPFLTHFAWSLRYRPSTGPYREAFDFAQKHPDSLPALKQSLGYLDTLHHAPRVQAPILVSVGLKDTTCPPPTVYSLIDRLRCIKSLLVLPDVGHEHVPDFYHHELAWFRRFLRFEPEGGVTLERLGLDALH